jgi:hypothetical protein
MAKSSRFRCPQCKAVLEKSGVAQLLGESGGYMAFGSGPIPCPTCRGPIDPRKMIEGAYDVQEMNGCLGLLCLAWMIGGPILLHNSLRWPLLWSLLAPWASIAAIGLLFGLAGKLFRRRT